uniref:Uncharacterized protein n=1 Tax=Romanomermis culicivorax TaxID=13658 RepID=A0A915HHV2_ROMCU
MQEIVFCHMRETNPDPPLAPAATIAPACDHCSNLAIANTNGVHNFRLEAGDVHKELNTAASRITNNVSTTQTINQIIGPVSNQFQAQQLPVQCEIQEQVQTMNAHFAALAEQMQQLISASTATAVACTNLPMPRKSPATSQFHGEEQRDIYIPNDTFRKTELALAYDRPPA